MATWHTPDTAQAEWADAPVDDEQLQQLLDVAKQAVLAYAPTLTDPVAPPTNYVYAQLMQARNVWNSSKASPSGDFDGGGYGLTMFPLDWQVKQVLRPRSIFGGPVG